MRWWSAYSSPMNWATSRHGSAEGHGGDQFTVLTAFALKTKNILLGTSITSVFVRSAPTIAMAAACVDHFSQGRFLLGLGTSHKVQVETGTRFAVRPCSTVPRLRECIDIVRTLLRDRGSLLPGRNISTQRDSTCGLNR